MNELFIEQILEMQLKNIRSLELIIKNTGGLNSSNWHFLKNKLIENELFSNNDINYVEGVISGEKLRNAESETVPSFITDRSININDVYFINKFGEVHKASKNEYDGVKNGTYVTNNDILAYKDHDGNVYITHFSLTIRDFLKYGCNMVKTHNPFSIPIDPGVNKFLDEDMQKKWEEWSEIKMHGFNAFEYLESIGKKSYLFSLTYDINSTLTSILKKDLSFKSDIQEIGQIIDGCGKRIKSGNELKYQELKELKTIKEKHQNPQLIVFRNWLNSISNKIKINNEKLEEIKVKALYGFNIRKLNEISLNFNREFFIPSPLKAIKEVESYNLSENIMDINKALSQYGIGLLDFERLNYFDNVDKRINETICKSVLIDKYLKIDCSKLFEDDMVLTNVNRLLLLSKKNKDNNYDEILNYIIEQLKMYLNNDNYEKYIESIRLSGISVDDHLEKINKKLNLIGLDLEDFRKKEKHIEIKYGEYKINNDDKDITQKFNLNKKIVDFSKKYFNIDINFNNDYLLNLLSLKILFENFVGKESRRVNFDSENYDLEQINKYGETNEEFFHKLVKFVEELDEEIVTTLNNDYKIQKIKEGYDWEKYEKKINNLLSKLNMNLQDLLEEGLIGVENLPISARTKENLSDDIILEMCKQEEKELKLRKLEHQFNYFQVYDEDFDKKFITTNNYLNEQTVSTPKR